MSESRFIVIRNEVDIINARLQTREMARDAGLAVMDQARISLAVSSLAHIIQLGNGYSGQIVLSRFADDNRSGVQVTWTMEADYDVEQMLHELCNSTVKKMVHTLDLQAPTATCISITALMWKS